MKSDIVSKNYQKPIFWIWDSQDEISKSESMETDRISDDEGLRLAYETKDGVYQHYNKLYIAGTKDFPIDHIDVLRLSFGDTLNKTT